MKQSVDIRYADSLSDIHMHIENICQNIKARKQRPLLWFRGHEYEYYNLEPNLFRGCDYIYNETKTYSQNHLREEYRYQNFMSRNLDKVELRMPQTMIEWQEVMQHYFTKTRLMDWSESLYVALKFALEAFIKPIKDLEVKEHCRTATPALWILEPVEMNKILYKELAYGKEEIITNTLNISDRVTNKLLARHIQEELQKEEKSGIYFNLNKEWEQNMNVLISLSSLEMFRSSYRDREVNALWNFELNPFFYLLLRYYSDGIPVEQEKLPPLAIIHPYHSSRIRNQRGVFTVFPFYVPNELHEKITGMLGKNPPIAMEYMQQCVPYLHKIQILNPHKVAEELMFTGARRGDLYPDMEIISQDMENII